MQVSKQLKLGVSEYIITGQGEDFHAALMDLGKASIYSLNKCGLCESDLLRFNAYLTKDDNYRYIKVVCGKCRGSLTLGESKQDRANYYRKNAEGRLDWKAYEGKEVKNSPSKTEKEILWEE